VFKPGTSLEPICSVGVLQKLTVVQLVNKSLNVTEPKPTIVHKLIQTNTEIILPSYFPKMHFNIILRSTNGSSMWSLPSTSGKCSMHFLSTRVLHAQISQDTACPPPPKFERTHKHTQRSERAEKSAYWLLTISCCYRRPRLLVDRRHGNSHQTFLL
jgi:hypothetical protein